MTPEQTFPAPRNWEIAMRMKELAIEIQERLGITNLEAVDLAWALKQLEVREHVNTALTQELQRREELNDQGINDETSNRSPDST
jgi:hypothetical protein